MAPVFLGPALVAAGAAIGSNKLVRTGIGLGFAIQASLIDVGMREIVPGANDNLAACAALVEIGRALAEAETPGLRILLISTGSEESNSEGMFSFAHKHFRNLKREDTVFITLEGLGSKHLTLLEGEGMLHMRDYSKMVNSELHAAAQDLGIGIRRGMRFRNSTDGVFALRGGYPAAMFGSINELRIIDNYHWPTDTPDNVDYQTCARAVGVSVRFIQRLLEGERWPWRPRTPAGEWRSLSRD
jgi:Iap family predicted aminopeptidase